jgi:hypothetical protein
VKPFDSFPVFMESERSLPHSQQLSTCLYPELHQSNPHHPISPRSNLILSTHLRLGLPSGLFLSGFLASNLNAFLFSTHSCYMARPSRLPRLDRSNYTWRRVQITKLLVMQFSPFSRYSFPLRSKIFLSTLFSNTLSLCSTKFRTHTESQAKL